MFNYSIVYEASRGTETHSVTAKSTGFGFDPHSRKLNRTRRKVYTFFLLILFVDFLLVLPAYCLSRIQRGAENNTEVI